MAAARHVQVTGRVQGVFFRGWTQEQAERLGVNGWVRNCPDGSVEAHLEGTMIVTCNTDQPGVIGAVGTVLGKHQINIAQFALGRNGDRAMGIVTVDEPTPISDEVLDELRQQKAIREVRLVRI